MTVVIRTVCALSPITSLLCARCVHYYCRLVSIYGVLLSGVIFVVGAVLRR